MVPLDEAMFVWIVIPLALIFTVLYFIFRSIYWFGLLAGLLWVLFGMFSLNNDVTEVFYYQRTLAPVWIIVGVAMFFSPVWFRRKQKSMGEELTEADNQDEFVKDLNEQEQAIRKYRSLGRKRRVI